MKTPLDCIMERENNPQIIGEYVCLKTRMSAGDAHYAGELVEGAHIVTAWGDVGTELAIRLFRRILRSKIYSSCICWRLDGIRRIHRKGW